MPGPLVSVGRVARAHGLKGRVLVVPHNPDSEGLHRLKRLWLAADGGEPQATEVTLTERVDLGYLVQFAQVEGRDAAEALRGREVLAERSALPKLPADEFYAADLVGLAVFDEAGVQRGKLVGFEAAGPNELMRVEVGGKEALVPFGLLRGVDAKAGRLVIEVPEGLFELEE